MLRDKPGGDVSGINPISVVWRRRLNVVHWIIGRLSLERDATVSASEDAWQRIQAFFQECLVEAPYRHCRNAIDSGRALDGHEWLTWPLALPAWYGRMVV